MIRAFAYREFIDRQKLVWLASAIAQLTWGGKKAKRLNVKEFTGTNPNPYTQTKHDDTFVKREKEILKYLDAKWPKKQP